MYAGIVRTMTEDPTPKHTQVRAWHGPHVHNSGGGPEYGDMVDALRDFLDGVAAAAPDGVTSAQLAHDLRSWTDRLADVGVGERRQLWARRLDVPGHAQTMAPRVAIKSEDRDSVHATVTFGRYFIGGGGAAHGGAVPLLFDEVLGRLSNSAGRPPSRTAYLHTDYRSITPIGEELTVHGWFVSEQGRKRILRAELRHGGTLCAEAEGLFIALRPGQP